MPSRGEPAPARERREVRFGGHVQGVGFRFTVSRLAAGRDVTGFVRNLPDGDVLLVLEGPPDVLCRLLEDVQSALGRYIVSTDVQCAAATHEFRSFSIRA
jgi:acylphosphatase